MIKIIIAINMINTCKITIKEMDNNFIFVIRVFNFISDLLMIVSDSKVRH